MKTLNIILPTLLVGVFAGSAVAATYSWEVDGDNVVPNTVANALFADGEGDDWTGIVMLVDLTAGSVYNGVPDSNTPQAAFWAVPGFEALEFDTWFGVPFDATNGVAGGAGDLGDLGGQIVASNKISITAFNTTVTDTGVNRIANITLSSDAAGTAEWIVAFAGSQLRGSSVIEGGVIALPEPATLSLMGFGGLAVLRRR